MRGAVYLTLCEDLLVVSNSNGSVRSTVITPNKYWSLGLNLAEFLVGLRVRNLSTNGGVTLKWQWSLDGKSWKTGATVISEKTTNDDGTGIHNIVSEQTPFTRIVAEVRDTTLTAEKSAEISCWGYYKFRA